MRWLPILVLALLAFSCVPTKMLKEGELLLYEQNIAGNKAISYWDLSPLIQQKTVRHTKFPRTTPYVHFYLIGKKKHAKDTADHKYLLKIKRTKSKIDKKIKKRLIKFRNKSHKDEKDTIKHQNKIKYLNRQKDETEESLLAARENGNWMMEALGEAPSIFDPNMAESTTIQMEKFYEKKGYFDTKVHYQLDTLGKKKKIASCTYQIEESVPYTVSKYLTNIPDYQIDSLIAADSTLRLVAQGDILDQSKLEEERDWLAREIKDRGFYGFNKAFITYQIDTALDNRTAHVTLSIAPPSKGKRHKKVIIDHVNFFTQVGGSTKDTVQDINYTFGNTKIHAPSINQMIYIRPGDPFSLSKVERTQRVLGSLDMFKFINIQLDTTAATNHMNIFTDPFEKFQYSIEFGLNVTQATPGPFTRLSLKDRNVFGRLEIMELSVRGAFEAQASATTTSRDFLVSGYNSIELGGDLSVTLPRILLPFQLHKTLGKRFDISTTKTQVKGGYSLVQRPEYTRTNIQATLSYQWMDQENDRYQINPIDVQIINTPVKSDAFQARLDTLLEQGNTLIFSFNNSFVTSSSFEYTRAFDFGKKRSRSKYFKLFLEAGGTYLNLVPSKTRMELFGLRTYQFGKLFFEYRQSIPIGRNSQFVLRTHVGAAIPYGSSDNVLPYEKYFFSGGSNSNRAWKPRRVGPGSYTPDVSNDGLSLDYSFEQPGELLFETNLEYRSKLISFIDWAAFVDATNVWLIQQDDTRPGGQISTQAWRELAIGTGIGLRLDFSFLIVRFDWGVRIMDPALPLGQRFLGDDLSFSNLFDRTDRQVLNFGIGYPF